MYGKKKIRIRRIESQKKVILDRAVKNSLSKQLSSEQRLQWYERRSRQREQECEGPEAGISLNTDKTDQWGWSAGAKDEVRSQWEVSLLFVLWRAAE